MMRTTQENAHHGEEPGRAQGAELGNGQGDYTQAAQSTTALPDDITLADWARCYRDDYGFALCAIPPGTKKPTMTGWPEINLAPEHWDAHPADGIGAVLGPSGLVSLDLDALPESRALLADLGLDLDAMTAGAYLVRGNPARLRALFRAPAGTKLTTHKLAWPPRDPSKPKDHPDGKPVTVFELRAGPVQDVLPPTIHPDTHKPYEWVRSPWDLDADLAEPPPELLELWTNWDAWKTALVAQCPWAKPPEPQAKPKAREHSAGLSVISAFNQAHDIRVILEAHGYKPKGKTRWLAPESGSGLPGVTLLPETGRIFSHHGADPLATGYALDCFEVYNQLEHGGDTRAAVKAAAALLGMDTRGRESGPTPPHPEAGDPGAWGETAESGWPEPEPLPTGLPPVQPFDLAMLPAAFRPWIGDIADRMQCPPDYPAVGALVALSAVVGRQCGIRPKRKDDWTVTPNLWGCVVGRPSLLKTPALVEPIRMVEALEAKAREDHDEAQKDHEADLIVAEAFAKEAKTKIGKAVKAGDSALAHALALEVGEGHEPPIRRRYITQDPTVEKLGELLCDNPRGILVYRDELVGFLRSLDREGREGSRAFYLEAWNGTGRYTYDRIGRGTIEIEAACVSILGAIPPGPLGDYMVGAIRGGMGDDGLVQRLQLAVWPDAPGTWRNVDRWPDTQARRTAREVFDRLDGFDSTAVGASQDSDDPIPWVRFDAEAQDEFDAWRADHEARLLVGDLHPALESHLAKFRSMVPSLSLLCHLADNPDGGPVGTPALLRALAWSEYLETHARRIYSPAIEPGMAAAVELDRRLRDLPAPFTAKDVYRNCWRHLDREGTALALAVLVDYGRIRGEETAGPGRPTVRYSVNPALLEAST